MKSSTLFLALSLTLSGVAATPTSFWLVSPAQAQSATSAEEQGTTPDDSTAAEEQGTVPEGSASPPTNAAANPSPAPQAPPLTREQRAEEALDDPNLSYKQRQKAEQKLLKHQKPLEEGADDGASVGCTTNCQEEERSELKPTE